MIQLVVAGVLHTSSTGKVGILGRVEPNRDAKMCRLTIRSTNEQVSREIKRLAMTPLHADMMAS
jgi:AP-2 complex subunit alpha